MTSPSPDRTTVLRTRASHFCTSFLSSIPPSQILTEHFIPQTPTILEHGPSFATARLPFLGIEFRGRKPDASDPTEGTKTCDDYFALLSQTLVFHPSDSTFPPASDFLVDCTADGGRGAVSVVAKGEFESVKTGSRWKEEFTYRLSGFDAEGRIGRWEIWADPLSAWVAVGGDTVGEGEGTQGRE